MVISYNISKSQTESKQQTTEKKQKMMRVLCSNGHQLQKTRKVIQKVILKCSNGKCKKEIEYGDSFLDCLECQESYCNECEIIVQKVTSPTKSDMQSNLNKRKRLRQQRSSE